jgi:hypothetical protein
MLDWLRRIHRNERGAVSLETILIIGAIALPILIFLLKHAWPNIRAYFEYSQDRLENSANDAANGG